MKRFYLLPILLICPILSMAASLTPEEAKARALEFINSSERHPAKGGMKDFSSSLSLAYESKGKELYVFNGSEGFIIVSGEEAAEPVLGYSDSGSFNPGSIPPQMEWLLEEYAAEISHAAVHELTSAPRSRAKVKPVEPLLGEIAWDQLYPYNMYCPNYYGKLQAATGCVATAMAQIMRFHCWPEKGRGSNSYTPTVYPNIGELTADFSQSAYDWDKMLKRYPSDPDQIAAENAEAVGRFLYDCGVAVNMEYGHQSGALSEDWCPALVDYFSYTPSVAHREKAYYSRTAWDEIIISELRAGRPVYAAGFTSEGGHAFVFDGCDADGLIHVNWGWSGMSNGYFRTSALTPSTQGTGGSIGGFNSRQIIITGIRPAAEGDLAHVSLASEEGLTSSRTKASQDEEINIRLSGRVKNIAWQDADCEMILALLSADGKTEVKRFPGVAIKLEAGKEMRNISFPAISLSGMADGNYRLAALAGNPGADNYEPVRDFDQAYPNYLSLTIADGNVSFSTPEMMRPEVTDLSAEGRIFSGMKGMVKATLANNGDVEYADGLKAAVYKPGEKRPSSVSEAYLVSITPGSEETVELVNTFSVEPGEYQLGIVDGANALISDLIDITVENGKAANPISVKNPVVKDAEEVIPEEMEVTATLKGDGGIFCGHTYAYIYDKKEDVTIGCLPGEFVQALPDAETTVVFRGPFENGMPGESYRVVLVNAETFSYITPRDAATAHFTMKGSSGIAETATGKEAKVYDICGSLRGVTEWKGNAAATLSGLSLEQGIYIIIAEGKRIKHILK